LTSPNVYQGMASTCSIARERERGGEREHSWRIREGTYVVEVKEAKGP